MERLDYRKVGKESWQALSALAKTVDDGPLPHALVLTGIVVAVSATAMALALGRRLEALDDE